MKKIFTAILFLFPLGEILRLDFANGVSLKPLDIGVGIIVVLWAIFKMAKKEKIKQKRVYVPILLFAGSGALSLLINYSNLTINQFFISLTYLVRWVAYAGIFFVVSDFDKEFKERILKLLIVIGSLIVASGYLQYIFYPNLRNLFYLGWDEHMYRIFSVFLDPNFAGAFFVLFFLFLINLFLKRKSIPIALLSFVTLGAVFLTFSRSALIMLVVSSSLLFVLMNRKILIVFLLVIILSVLAISSRNFNIENINLFRVASSEARIETTRNAIKIIQDHPILGVGFNAYRYAQFRYGFRNEANPISHADASPDNSFLFIMATTGIVGFILYSFLWLRLLENASILAIASVAGVFIDSLFINGLFYPFIALWLWIILALSISPAPSSRSVKFKQKKYRPKRAG